MISLETYRVRIGTFHHKNVIKSKQKLFSQQEQGTNLSKTFFTNCLIFLGVLIVVNVSFLKLSLLIQHGDVETNPGPPYSIMKSVTGTCHQGDIAKFSETAGRQCLCNAMYAIAWSIVKRIGLWTNIDLDHILNEGDQIYKLKNTFNYLTTEDLPESVKINETELIIVKLANYHGHLNQVEHFISSST